MAPRAGLMIDEVCQSAQVSATCWPYAKGHPPSQCNMLSVQCTHPVNEGIMLTLVQTPTSMAVPVKPAHSDIMLSCTNLQTYPLMSALTCTLCSTIFITVNHLALFLTLI